MDDSTRTSTAKAILSAAAVVAAATLGQASTALAEDSPTSTVKSVRVWLGSVDVYLKDITYTCGSSTNSRYNLGTTQHNYQTMFTAIMAAYLSGKSLQLRYECGDDDIAYVTGVRLF